MKSVTAIIYSRQQEHLLDIIHCCSTIDGDREGCRRQAAASKRVDLTSASLFQQNVVVRNNHKHVHRLIDAASQLLSG